jgi:hypothetical protein
MELVYVTMRITRNKLSTFNGTGQVHHPPAILRGPMPFQQLTIEASCHNVLMI